MEDNTMKKYNLWKSEYTGVIYELPVDFMPTYLNGWQLVGTIEKEED
jgi:hypothetical protein